MVYEYSGLRRCLLCVCLLLGRAFPGLLIWELICAGGMVHFELLLGIARKALDSLSIFLLLGKIRAAVDVCFAALRCPLSCKLKRCRCAALDCWVCLRLRWRPLFAEVPGVGDEIGFEGVSTVVIAWLVVEVFSEVAGLLAPRIWRLRISLGARTARGGISQGVLPWPEVRRRPCGCLPSPGSAQGPPPAVSLCGSRLPSTRAAGVPCTGTGVPCTGTEGVPCTGTSFFRRQLECLAPALRECLVPAPRGCLVPAPRAFRWCALYRHRRRAEGVPRTGTVGMPWPARGRHWRRWRRLGKV